MSTPPVSPPDSPSDSPSDSSSDSSSDSPSDSSRPDGDGSEPRSGPPEDVRAYNRAAWDHLVAAGDQWTVPVGPEAVAAARRGRVEIVLTPTRPVPAAWLGELAGRRVLCLAGGGGQQGPLLAAAGARVTVLDASPAQLGQDRRVAEREGLALATVLGDMADLGAFPDAAFDLVVHPCSNCFVPRLEPVWREAHRVLADGGELLAGFIDPAAFVFDLERAEAGEVVVRHRLPYADIDSLSEDELADLVERGEPLLFGHSLEEQIGGQLEAGFALTGLYQDTWPPMAFSEHLPTMIATRAVKVKGTQV